MTPKEIVLAQIRHEETEKIPYTLAFEPEILSRLNAYYGGDFWQKRLIPYLVDCGSVAKMPTEKIDAHHFRDAFGTVWRTDSLPHVVVEPGLKKPSFDGYRFPSATEFLNNEVKAETARKVRDYPDSFTYISCPCLWSCWYLRGFDQTLMDCITEEDFYQELLERMTELTLAHIAFCSDIPAHAIMMGDDWGYQKGVLIGPERWRRFYKPRYARIFQAIHQQEKIAIMHCCGSVAQIMADIVEIGLDVLESVQPEAAGMNPYLLKKEWGDKITFWGGLGSQSTIPFGTPEQIRQEIRHLRKEMTRGGGYILAPAKPLRPETPTENAVAVVEEFISG